MRDVSDERPPLRLLPFRATTYAPDVDLRRVICPPYDLIDAATRRSFEAMDQHNIVHVTLPQLPEATSRGDRYAHARALLSAWLDAGVLRTDDTPALYVYEHRSAGRSVVGLVGGLGLDGPILAHENTFPGPVEDRTALMKETRAQLEPILLTYDGDGHAGEIVDALTTRPPDRLISLDEDEQHRVWRLDDPSALRAVADDLATRTALIVDGHHRFAAYQSLHTAEPSTATGCGLAMLVDSRHHPLELRGVHRSVAGLAAREALSAAGEGFDVVPVAPGTGSEDILAGDPGPAFVVGDRHEQALVRSPRPSVLDRGIGPDCPEQWRRLDAAVLTEVLLAQLWGVADADERVGYHHAARDALDTAERTNGTAVLVRPPELSDVVALAERGVRMPRKSTSFVPKPWTGLIMRLLDEEPA